MNTANAKKEDIVPRLSLGVLQEKGRSVLTTKRDHQLLEFYSKDEEEVDDDDFDDINNSHGRSHS